MTRARPAEIAVLGAGVMGSAMSLPAGARGHRIALVGTHLDADIVRAVAGNGHHPRLGVTLPAGVTAQPWDAFGAVMASPKDLLILGVSSAGVGWAIDRLVEGLRAPLPVLMITKGLAADGETIAVLPDLVRREVKARSGLDLPVMAVGGPCIAGELAAGRETSVVITGSDADLIARTIDMLGADFYHARPCADIVGVEVCAAFKNFFALGVGWAGGRLERDGRAANGALRHNLAASIFTQALAEMQVLVSALGGARETVVGLAGAGDLYVTCQAGRNSRMGQWLGRGLRYREAKAAHMAQDTVEGAELALALGPTLRTMMAKGRLPAARLPLLCAILDAVCDDAALEIDPATF